MLYNGTFMSSITVSLWESFNFFSDFFDWISEGETQFYDITIAFLDNNPLPNLVDPQISFPFISLSFFN